MAFYTPQKKKEITNPNKYKAAQLASLKKPYNGIKKPFKRSHDTRPKYSERVFFRVFVRGYTLIHCHCDRVQSPNNPANIKSDII